MIARVKTLPPSECISFKLSAECVSLCCPAFAGLVPGSAADALRVTHGRPPCALVTFGIGGRVAILKPVPVRGMPQLWLCEMLKMWQ